MAPSGRLNSGLAVHGDYMYVFGGRRASRGYASSTLMPELART